MSDVAANVEVVRARIHDAARRAGRDGAEVTLVAATKTVTAERVAEAVEAGVTDLGENRAQELVGKAPLVRDLIVASPDRVGSAAEVRWHFLGALQRNKVKALAPWVTCWQSVDREALADVLARHAPGGRVLVEVNLAGEAQKAGCAPDAVAGLVEGLVERGLVVDGLMTVPPHGDDPRPWFARLRELASGLGLVTLSMGMTDDFEAAIEEGATMVRVGRALFGPRHHAEGSGR